MEFDRPDIFKKDNENIKDNSINKFHIEIQNRQYEELYKPLTPSLYKEEIINDNFNINKNSKKYIGIKNIKLIDEISKYIIQVFYSSSFKTERIKIFYLLNEVLLYIESNSNLKDCYFTYKEEILTNSSKRINSKFINYILQMIDINLNNKYK